MIKLRKGSAPTELVVNGNRWRQEYVDGLAAGKKRSELAARYRNPPIKAALIVETNGKCAYCESKIMHTQHGDVEHIEPVSNAAPRVVDWTNLTLVCTLCNNEKSDYWNPVAPLVNPYTDDPADHIAFAGPYAATKSPVGFATIRHVALNRVALVERRTERIDALMALVHEWMLMPNGQTKSKVEQLIREFCAEDKEFSASAASVVELVADKVSARRKIRRATTPANPKPASG